MAFVLQFHEEIGSHLHPPLDWPHSFNAWACVYAGCGMLLTILLILAECPHYSEDCLHSIFIALCVTCLEMITIACVMYWHSYMELTRPRQFKRPVLCSFSVLCIHISSADFRTAISITSNLYQQFQHLTCLHPG